jgi:hypothetical protein
MYPSLQDMLNAKFAKQLSGRDKPCRICNQTRKGEVIFTNLSSVIRIESDFFSETINAQAMKYPIDNTITLQDSVYRLVGVVYHNGGHFTSRFLRQMNGNDSNSKIVCWSYDGMLNSLSDIKVDCPMVPFNTTWFPYTLAGSYKAVLLYYLDETCFCTPHSF